ncbi:MAG TPA: flagellar type III secretion system pore protein FliP [Anaerohalosphaeraceae bacterium]|nr:flagellar type III secretion system pore protein FliP [Anaerohalosphaeraceae bacterium]HOT71687.1 flagellar type III secretion system pore protein FliP [Anaerohalosphaeraceae bacterium]HPB93410.1 flagellar type III secretion system pore protein FliP [Anaerohalosphaeraceae bacterium]HQG04660.1 flagellar type III secretion system pore protein FliP [Anaerohalosphaeraceae bacterium]HQI06510.1 flagellar type III secretion system pore protein FliP [Anaerohalosphaeraceae bacterium]
MRHFLSFFWLVVLLTAAAPAQAPAAEAAISSESTTLPTLEELIQMIDKASADPQQQAPTPWSGPIRLVFLFTLLALLPSVLAMMTSFTRIAIVLGFVRRALGTQNIPPNTALLGLALFLTLFTMAPTFSKIHQEAILPYLSNQMELQQSTEIANAALKNFMLRQTRTSDLTVFVNMAKITPPAYAADLPLHIITPAFVISEFRTAFEIGCLMFIPFLLLDLVISSVLLSAGMMMLPPVMISLPFKLILFILVDGWGILAQGLSLSFK